MTAPGDRRNRPVTVDERSGVLFPDRLRRYAAGWIDPDPAVATVVDQYWHVSWALDAGERLEQPIIDLPAVTLTIEESGAPPALVVTGPHSRAWRRAIHGSGRVFAIRLRPAGLAVLSDLACTELVDTTTPLTPDFDARLHAIMRTVAAAADPGERARVADRAIGGALAERAPSPGGLLANEVLDELRQRAHHRTGRSLAEHFARSERTIQRACVETLGQGPKRLSRRIRLQEVARALATRPVDELADIAAELGYTDQTHLTRDFRTTTGMTPDAYRRTLRDLTGG